MDTVHKDPRNDGVHILSASALARIPARFDARNREMAPGGTVTDRTYQSQHASAENGSAHLFPCILIALF